MKRLMLLILFAACGDNNHVPAQPDSPVIIDAIPADAPIQTWTDAWRVWANAWCTLAARCDPDHFAYYYPNGHAECVVDVVADNCNLSPWPCSDPYERSRLGALARCETDMDNLACGADQAPDSCFEAFW